MSILSESVLTESASARSSHLSNFDDTRAEEVLNKVKSLYFAVWENRSITISQELASFYEVSGEIVKKAVQRHKKELTSDGLKVLKGKALKDARDSLSLAEKISILTVWTPRAAMRLGLILTGSEIASTLRTTILNLALDGKSKGFAPI